ncbi:MAG TPA: hypothetical protein VMW66_03375 [Elusimicrobiales bacterium]|nr:hypothetical protein [Elusimicrobiales bacterium]
MNFSVTGRKKKLKYTVISVAFLFFAVMWVSYPFLNSKTVLHPGASSFFTARAVDLSSIKIKDLQGSAPGTIIARPGLFGSAPANSKEKTSGSNFENKPIRDSQKKAVSKDRYTPSAGTAVAKKGDKGYASSDSAEEKSAGGNSASGSGGMNFGSGGASTSASAKFQNLFGTKAIGGKFEGDKKKKEIDVEEEGEVMSQVKFVAGQTKLATEYKSPEWQKEAEGKAFEDISEKDLNEDLKKYQKTGLSELLEIEKNLIKSSEGTGTVRQASYTFPTMPDQDPAMDTGEQLRLDRELFEQQIALAKESGGGGMNALLLQVGIAILLGPVLGILPIS